MRIGLKLWLNLNTQHIVNSLNIVDLILYDSVYICMVFVIVRLHIKIGVHLSVKVLYLIFHIIDAFVMLDKFFCILELYFAFQCLMAFFYLLDLLIDLLKLLVFLVF